jgi:hypothetical protein
LTFDLKSGKSRPKGRNARILDGKNTNKVEANPVGGVDVTFYGN